MEGFSLYYRLDRDDRIIEVGGAWDDFARKNDAAGLCGDGVIGRPLFDFVRGDAPQMLTRSLLEAVRVLGRTRSVNYRCDSPRIKRFMEMRVTLEADRGLKVEHRMARCEALAEVHLFRVATAPAKAIVVRCTLCNRVKTGPRWQEPEELPPGRGDFVPVIYGVCEDCQAMVRAG